MRFWIGLFLGLIKADARLVAGNSDGAPFDD